MNKVYTSAEAAVADIAAGASVAIAGFGMNYRFPNDLIAALVAQGAGDLSIICNSLGEPGVESGHSLVENNQVTRLVTSFSSRPKMRATVEDQIAAGTIALELVPQGVLVERLRAAAAGLPAFYSPVTAGTPLADGKETRVFDGRTHVLETALPVEYAFVRAWRGDRYGNLEFRGSSQNLNPSFAKAARTTIAEVDEVVDALPPERVGLPGIFVSRVVATGRVRSSESRGLRRRPPDSARTYDGRPALSRMEMARRTADLLPDGAYVNLGTGLPALVGHHVADRPVTLHAENGVLGYSLALPGDEHDLDLYDASGGFVALRPGASVFDSVESFEMARSGRLDAVVLGGYQVDEDGSLANWSTPGMVGGGIGGAMDLAAGVGHVIALLEHCDRSGRTKLVARCDFPLTAPACVTTIVTDLGLFVRGPAGFVLVEIAPGISVAELREVTEMRFDVASRLGDLRTSTTRYPELAGAVGSAAVVGVGR